MSSLLIQSCSATKQDVEKPVQALDLYDGYFFKIIKKAKRADEFQPGLDILIISAKYGVVEPTDEIGYYDRRMDSERAKELNEEVVIDIVRKVSDNNYGKIWINLGKDYLPAVEGVERAVNIPVSHIKGSGIGMKGKQLKHLVSSRASVLANAD